MQSNGQGTRQKRVGQAVGAQRAQLAPLRDHGEQGEPVAEPVAQQRVRRAVQRVARLV